MNNTRMNGKAFSFNVGTMDLKADKWNLGITDNSAVAKKNGRPDGTLPGDVEASGEVTLDRIEFKKLSAAAKKAGSWQDMETFNIVSYAKVGTDENKVEAFGCKFKLESVLDVDKGSTDKTSFSLKFDVTSPDFVRIDGVPYIKPEKK